MASDTSSLSRFHRAMHLHLVPCLSAFSEELEVYTVDEAGGQQHLPLEKGHFYTGSVLGEGCGVWVEMVRGVVCGWRW